MALARCPNCDVLKEITPTDQPVGHTGTAKRWRVVLHVTGAPGADGARAFCDGSGKLI